MVPQKRKREGKEEAVHEDEPVAVPEETSVSKRPAPVADSSKNSVVGNGAGDELADKTPESPQNFNAAGIHEEDWSTLNRILSESNQYEVGSGERQTCLEKIYSKLRRIYSMKPEGEDNWEALLDPKSARKKGIKDKAARPVVDVNPGEKEPKEQSLSSAPTPMASSPPKPSSPVLSAQASPSERPRRSSRARVSKAVCAGE